MNILVLLAEIMKLSSSYKFNMYDIFIDDLIHCYNFLY